MHRAPARSPSRRRVRRGAPTLVLALVSLSAIVPATARAQEIGRPLLGFAAGADLRNADGARPLWLAQASAEWRRRGRALGVRAELSYGERATERLGQVISFDDQTLCPRGGCVSTLELSSKVRGYGAALNATYEFLRESTARPYLVSGVGVLTTRRRLAARATPYVPCAACESAAPDPSTLVPFEPLDRTWSHTALTLDGGAGVAFDVRRVHLFTELRYQLDDDDMPRAFGGILPLTIGIRF